MPRWSIASLVGAQLMRFGRKWRAARGRHVGRKPTRDLFVFRGASRNPAYVSWRAMWRRCTDPGHKRYYLYGGRGITVAQEWNSFAQFLKDLGPRPEGQTLERIDNAKGYGPGNCKWATPREQASNRRPWGTCVAR